METQTADREETETRGVASLDLETRHEVALVVDAFSARAKTLEDLAKKNQGEGYTQFASSLVMDAAILKQRIAPRIAAQRSLPLPTVEDLEKQVAGLLSAHIYRGFAGLASLEPKTTEEKEFVDKINYRKEEMRRQLGEVIARLTMAAARFGYEHGYQVRSRSDEAIALDALDAVRAV